jgi:hypothetical protein
LVEVSDDPEYAAQLSSLLHDSGARAEAETWRARAAARYSALLAAHPAAFADHAARFWLGPGGAPQKALELAQLNLRGRATADSYALVLEAALSASADGVACRMASRALALARPSPQLRIDASLAAKRCPSSARLD